jgi:hypothetical protein
MEARCDLAAEGSKVKGSRRGMCGMSLELRIDAFDYYADVWMFISSFDGQTESIFIDIAAFV